jgi:hypothetical protein
VGGVVASGTIVEEAEEREDEDRAVAFWVTPRVKALRVRLRIDRVANAKEMLKRDWFKDDPVLSDLRILRFASETNYRLSPEQARRLESLWLNTGRDWNEAESIAGLWAYVCRVLSAPLRKRRRRCRAGRPWLAPRSGGASALT